MGHHVVEFDCKCESCEGTGLYKGWNEREGVAAICGDCKGTGKQHRKIQYDDFEGRQRREDVKHVFQVAPGSFARKGSEALSDLGGMPYDQWFNGRPFEAGMEMRKFTCPLWWSQVAGGKDPEWKECLKAGEFKDCKHYKKKAKCWAKWDKERQDSIEARNQVTDETPKGTKPA